MAATARDGLRITGIFGDTSAHPRTAIDLARVEGPFDLALVSVKSHATEAVTHALAAWTDRPALVVSLQNGLGNVELLANALGAEQVLGARVIFGAIIP